MSEEDHKNKKKNKIKIKNTPIEHVVEEESPSLSELEIQLVAVIEENARLEALIEEKDGQVFQLSEALLTMKEDLNLLQSQDLQRTAQDIARRNRDLSNELAKARGNIFRLEKELNETREALKFTDLEGLRQEKEAFQILQEELNSDDNVLAAATKEAKEWMEKHDAVNSRLVELRTQMAVLKSENTKLMRFLKKEVGEDISIADLVNSQSNRRGRAEEISILKLENSELKKKLHSQTVSSPSSDFSGSITTELPRSTAAVKNRAQIDNLKKNKQEEISNLTRENNELNEMLKKMKLRSSAAIAREKTMDSDIKSLRSKLKLLLEKSSTDDSLIDGFRAQVESQGRQIQKLVKKLEDNTRIFDNTEKLDEQIDTQAKIIRKLKIQLDDFASESESKHSLSVKHKAVLRELDRSEANHSANIKAMQSQLLHTSQMIESLEARVAHLTSNLIASNEENVDLARKIEAIQGGKKNIGKARSHVDAFAELRTTYIENLHAKDEELAITKSELEELRIQIRDATHI